MPVSLLTVEINLLLRSRCAKYQFVLLIPFQGCCDLDFALGVNEPEQLPHHVRLLFLCNSMWTLQPC